MGLFKNLPMLCHQLLIWETVRFCWPAIRWRHIQSGTECNSRQLYSAQQMENCTERLLHLDLAHLLMLSSTFLILFCNMTIMLSSQSEKCSSTFKIGLFILESQRANHAWKGEWKGDQRWCTLLDGGYSALPPPGGQPRWRPQSPLALLYWDRFVLSAEVSADAFQE